MKRFALALALLAAACAHPNAKMLEIWSQWGDVEIISPPGETRTVEKVREYAPGDSDEPALLMRADLKKGDLLVLREGCACSMLISYWMVKGDEKFVKFYLKPTAEKCKWREYNHEAACGTEIWIDTGSGKKLSGIDLYPGTPPDTIRKIIGRMDEPVSVRFSMGEGGHKGELDLSFLESFRNLKALSIEGTKLKNIRSLAALKDLEVLSLNFVRIGDEGLVDAIRDLGKLKILYLEISEAPDAGKLLRLNLKRFRSIWRMYLDFERRKCGKASRAGGATLDVSLITPATAREGYGKPTYTISTYSDDDGWRVDCASPRRKIAARKGTIVKCEVYLLNNEKIRGYWEIKGDEKRVKFVLEPIALGYKVLVDTGRGRKVAGFWIDAERLPRGAIRKLCKDNPDMVFFGSHRRLMDERTPLDASELDRARNLRVLDIQHAVVKNFRSVAKLKSLRILQLNSVLVDSIEPVSELEQLRVLTLRQVTTKRPRELLSLDLSKLLHLADMSIILPRTLDRY